MKRARADRPRDILVVEDNPGDVRLLRVAFEGVEPRCVLHAEPTGDAALRTLADRSRSASQDLPDLVLLDLNLPGLDGREVLELLRADPASRHVPVVVFSTSNDPDDVRTCYALGANAFIRKPFGLDGYRFTAASLASFWFGTARLPGE